MYPIRFGAVFALLALFAFSARSMEPRFLLRVSTPFILSAAGELKFGQGEGYHPVLEAEAGIGGGKIAVGLHAAGERLDLGLKGAFVRTWLEPVSVDEDMSFLGIEGELGIKRLVLSAGGYRRISNGDDDWLGSAGIGFKF